MSYTILNAKSDLNGILKGTTTNKITNILGVFERAARDILLEIDPAETRREAQITNAIYDKVYDYVAPTDLKSDKIIDIFPQVNRSIVDNMHNTYAKNFDMRKGLGTEMFSVESNTGIKVIRIKANVDDGTTISN
jgi:hypothetical protein